MTQRGRGRPRHEDVDAAIVDAAVAELAEKGLAATMEGIATRAGIAKATLYRRWPNRLALLQFLADQLIEVGEASNSGELRKDLLSVFEPLAKTSYGEGPVARLAPMFIAAAAHDEQMRAFVAAQSKAHRSGALVALKRARKRGDLRDGIDLNVTVDLVAGALSERAYLLGKSVTPAYVRKVVDQAIAGILA